jgi:4-hydroxy-tetrahydrodipicolinate synthase
MSKTENFIKGVLTALITPFADGKIDFAAVQKMLDQQLEANIDGIVLAGSTGEGNFLSEQELSELIKFTKDHIAARTKITVGTASASTEESLNRAKIAEALGVDAVMLTVPYYVKPGQEGLYQHFKIIHDQTSLPIVVYTNPGRTGIDLADETIIRLAKLDRVIALKDAGGDIERPVRIGKYVDSSFHMLSGDDSNLIAFLAHGGHGLISVTSNILPKSMRDLYLLYKAGQGRQALELQRKLYDIYGAIFAESNPIGTKCAANMMGLCNDELRLPLTPATMKTRERLNSLKSLFLELENERRI